MPTDEESFPNTVVYSHYRLERISRLLTTTIASTLPVVSMVVLFVVNNTLRRLGLVGFFTALFSLTLGLLTSGTPIEIFSATAA